MLFFQNYHLTLVFFGVAIAQKLCKVVILLTVAINSKKLHQYYLTKQTTLQ